MNEFFRPKPRRLIDDLERLFDGVGRKHLTQHRVGIDVVSIDEFARTMATRAGKALVGRAFSAAEREYSNGRPDRLAVRWAAKEAVVKAIGSGFRGIRPSDIEVRRQETGIVWVTSAGGNPWPEDAHEWDWSISLCDEGDAAVAIAIARTPDDSLGISTGLRKEH